MPEVLPRVGPEPARERMCAQGQRQPVEDGSYLGCRGGLDEGRRSCLLR